MAKPFSLEEVVPDLYSADEVAEKLHVSKKVVLELFHRGELSGKRIGKKLIRFSVDAVLAYLEREDSGATSRSNTDGR